jgi:hypothetical protein
MYTCTLHSFCHVDKPYSLSLCLSVHLPLWQYLPVYCYISDMSPSHFLSVVWPVWSGSKVLTSPFCSICTLTALPVLPLIHIPHLLLFSFPLSTSFIHRSLISNLSFPLFQLTVSLCSSLISPSIFILLTYSLSISSFACPSPPP